MKNEGSIKDLSRQKKDLINFKIDPLRLSSLSNGKKKKNRSSKTCGMP